MLRAIRFVLMGQHLAVTMIRAVVGMVFFIVMRNMCETRDLIKMNSNLNKILIMEY